MSSPSRNICPSVGSSSLKIIRPRVDLPQPLSPTNPRVSPLNILRETPSTAVVTVRFPDKNPACTVKYFFNSRMSISGDFIIKGDMMGSSLLVKPAVDFMSGRIFFQPRLILPADIHYIGTPVMKSASFRQIVQL